MRGMSTPPYPTDPSATLVWHRGRGVAIVTATQAWIIPSIDRRPPGDPVRKLIAAKCVEAMEILSGERPGPYNDREATARALACVRGPRPRMRRRPAPHPAR